MALIIKTENDSEKAPHLALTHKRLQGGAANGRNVSLLMKSDVEITPEIATLIKKVAGVDVSVTKIEKASYNDLNTALSEAIKKFSDNDNEYYWSWVVDFDEQFVVFSNEDGLFYTEYTINGDVVTLGDNAIAVKSVVTYEEKTGALNLNVNNDGEDENDANNGVKIRVQSLIVKSFDNISKNKKLINVLKSIHEKGKQMDEVTIQKAVDGAVAPLKAQLEKAASDLTKANETIEALQKAAGEAKEAVRKSKIDAVIKDADKAAEILKAVAPLDDAGFDVVLKSFQEKVEVLEKGDLFKRVSAVKDIEKGDGEPMHITILKKQFHVDEK